MDTPEARNVKVAPNQWCKNINTEMTPQQEKFLHLYLVDQLTYDEVAQEMGVPRVTLTEWYDTLKTERTRIAGLRTLWNKQKPSSKFSEFYDWYLENQQKCHYCGITEDQIKTLYDLRRLHTKRISTRGKRLELDRLEPHSAYRLDNLAFVCFWCLQAKSDEFSSEEFKEIGKAIKKVWQKRLEDEA
jgi:5-methylcytosine-specific restriction endonuclease McrA